MSNPHNLKAGQNLWYVPNRGAPKFLMVEKLGRVWAGCGNLRVNVETLAVDGGDYSSPGSCHTSKEAWDIHQARQIAWLQLRERVLGTYTLNPEITEAEIRQAAKLLGIALGGAA